MRTVRFGIIGGGLMGREFASAAARWLHLADLDVRPEIVHVCDANPDVLAWYERLQPAPRLSTDWGELLDDPDVEAVYCAVPHHLHGELYVAILEAGRHLLGEKPFGIDLDANRRIRAAVASHPELLVRCSSEMPFFPGGQAVARWLAEGRAVLSDVVTERPDGHGGMAPCDTPDNAVLLCEADGFPMRIETKRMAPGETNTWLIEIDGTEGSIAFSTKTP